MFSSPISREVWNVVGDPVVGGGDREPDDKQDNRSVSVINGKILSHEWRGGSIQYLKSDLRMLTRKISVSPGVWRASCRENSCDKDFLSQKFLPNSKVGENSLLV